MRAGFIIIGLRLLTACGDTENRKRSWSHVHVGSKVYVAGDPTWGQVCPSLDAYYEAWHSHTLGQCYPLRPGTPGIVEAIYPSKPSDPDPGMTHVKLRAVNGTWRGFTIVQNLQPDILVGSVLVMGRDWTGPLTLGRSVNGPGPDIGPRATVKVLRYVPTHPHRSVFVRVLDGDFKGREGWMFMGNSETDGIGTFGMAD